MEVIILIQVALLLLLLLLLSSLDRVRRGALLKIGRTSLA